MLLQRGLGQWGWQGGYPEGLRWAAHRGTELWGYSRFGRFGPRAGAALGRVQGREAAGEAKHTGFCQLRRSAEDSDGERVDGRALQAALHIHRPGYWAASTAGLPKSVLQGARDVHSCRQGLAQSHLGTFL